MLFSMVCVSRSLASAGSVDLGVFLPKLPKYIYSSGDIAIYLLNFEYEIDHIYQKPKICIKNLKNS